jgi:hypothetical protein
MRREFSAAQYVSRMFYRISAAFLGAALTASMLAAQTPKPDLPDPVKFVNKFEIVWNVVRATLNEMDYQIELEDRQAGKITTKPYEFITGTLTSSEVDKVAIKQDVAMGNWLKARYSVEALLENVSPTETMLTISTKMEALNRNLDASEKWLPIQSLGMVERRILGKISMKLMGYDSQADYNKGFWNKSPQPVDARPPRVLKPTPSK